uniref:Fibrinogen C-terminal domain-containing protein n=1 Tax=Amphimedon queenslandica TaxID=400682 RepID=A0A1X7TE08_AMPQE
METDGGGWTVFQRRQDGSVDFYRYWTDYENGFGNLTGEFWLGLSKIHRLTKEGSNTLRVDLGDFEGNTRYANYSTFNLGDGSTEYILTVGGYSGNARDSLIGHNGWRFSTRDNDNDGWSGGSCAQIGTGAWWYESCYASNLKGHYFHTATRANPAINWLIWKDEGLKFTEMKTRLTIDEGQGSYCMAASTGYKHEPSLFMRTCCNSSNLGQTVTIRGIGKTRCILCPKVRPKSCTSDNRDCKSLLETGFDISGVYTVNPDGGLHLKYTVIWRLMVVDGLYFRGDKMNLMIPIETGLTMRMNLVTLLVSFS